MRRNTGDEQWISPRPGGEPAGLNCSQAGAIELLLTASSDRERHLVFFYSLVTGAAEAKDHIEYCD